jgi:hypothetical protein
MRIIRFFSHVNKGFKTSFNFSGALSITALMLSLFSQQISAYQVDLEIVDDKGGKISRVENNYGCTGQCIIQTFPKKVISLFALANEGYRFVEWEGACKNNLGPLCTLTLNDGSKVSARFVKTDLPSLSTQAILLLHDISEESAVWNEYVKQRFKNFCPVIYGGVLLGKDSFDTRNHIACYRIQFGYYGHLYNGLLSQAGSNFQLSTKAKNHYFRTHLSHEIRAAVLGILNRHPNLNLTIVSHGHADSAARSYLNSLADERMYIKGLLTLNSNNSVTEIKNVLNPNNDEIDGLTSFKINAKPQQSRKINAALVNLINAN